MCVVFFLEDFVASVELMETVVNGLDAQAGVFARSLSGPGVYEFLSSPPATWAKPRPARPSETGGGGGGTDVGDGIIE